jgi:hypothetical protein
MLTRRALADIPNRARTVRLDVHANEFMTALAIAVWVHRHAGTRIWTAGSSAQCSRGVHFTNWKA